MPTTKTAAEIRVRYSHTSQVDKFADLDAALASLRSVYGEEIATEGDLDDGRVLVWRDEESSLNDDGARAVASIYRVYV
jgi:hypothetical protein